MDLRRFFHISRADFQGFFNRRLIIPVVMAAILYLGTGIYYKVLTIQLIRMRPAPAAEKKAQAAVQTLREPMDAYRGIAERNIFGTTTKVVVDKQAAAAPVLQQDIALLFDLRGTVAGEGKYGFAVIEEKGTRKQRLVKAGDIVAGAQVVRIKRNALDLLVNGRERTLTMVEAKEGPIVPAPAASGPQQVPSGPVIVSQNEVRANLQDMGSMLRQAQIRPYFNAGVPDGFMISNIVAGSLYQKMGIQEGDILQTVNNKRIQTAEDMVSLYNTLKSGSTLDISIKRGGNQQTLNFLFQ